MLFTLSPALHSKAVCLGDCSVVPSSVLLGGNLLEPVLNRAYTDSFLHSMGESAVLQNLNLGSGGTRPFSGYRVGLGYAAARSKLEKTGFALSRNRIERIAQFGRFILIYDHWHFRVHRTLHTYTNHVVLDN